MIPYVKQLTSTCIYHFKYLSMFTRHLVFSTTGKFYVIALFLMQQQ